MHGEERVIPEGLSPTAHWNFALSVTQHPFDLSPALPEGIEAAVDGAVEWEERARRKRTIISKFFRAQTHTWSF